MFNNRKWCLRRIKPGMGTLIVVWIAFALSSILAELPMLIFPVYIIGIAVAIILEKNNTLKRKYVVLIENHRITSMDEIAQTCSLSYDKVSKDINKMIEQGFFENTYIDFSNRRIVLPNNNIDINTEIVEETVICQCCGATSKVSPLSNNKCEYCGTVLIQRNINETE